MIRSKMLNFEEFLPPKIPLMTTLSDTRALTSRKYVAEDTKSNPEQFKSYELFQLHVSIFALQL